MLSICFLCKSLESPVYGGSKLVKITLNFPNFKLFLAFSPSGSNSAEEIDHLSMMTTATQNRRMGFLSLPRVKLLYLFSQPINVYVYLIIL